MSKQIAVRLPDDLMEFVDQQVANGAASRADVVKQALKRERRRVASEREIAILIRYKDDPDLEIEAFHAWADRHPPPPLD